MKPDVPFLSSTASRILLLLICLQFYGFSQQTVGTEKPEEDAERIVCFERLVNSVLTGEANKVQFDPFFMDGDDIDYWMGQFVFSDDVLEQISPEAFNNKLEGWAGSAEASFLSSLEGADHFKIANSEFKTDSDPGLRVSRLANLAAHVYREDAVIGRLYMTLIDVRGQFKLIQVELR